MREATQQFSATLKINAKSFPGGLCCGGRSGTGAPDKQCAQHGRDAPTHQTRSTILCSVFPSAEGQGTSISASALCNTGLSPGSLFPKHMMH